MSERIVAAAIREGCVVFTGPRHHRIIWYMVPLLRIPRSTGEQGFMTSEGRFVSRTKAALIAHAAGQTAVDHGVLMSEQLWDLAGWMMAPPNKKEVG